ncbi:hypothetical protein [Paraburkholderia tagetis]|uniref:Uncharacterized protein n=1 Tax=Paraburkholderia tagetis TaxID=2913261 RepID=A0A9X1UGP2_9BURK|nr:hypothetical protein [Paraburkholderia tagetis]MCG5075700.1 hypothetical protein [Paraburkholderia tagetis]
MPTPAEEQIKAQLDLLLQLELDGMDAVDKANLRSEIRKIEVEYAKSVEKGKSSAYYKDVSDSIAKNLPALVNGIYSANNAFKKGDYVSGSAAIMNICASVLPILTAVSATAGPAGVLIGAIFSVVAQILSFFAPQQPSLESKIAKLLDQLRADEEIETIKAFSHSISSYTSSLRSKCLGEKKWKAAVALSGTVSLEKGSTEVVGTNTKFSATAEVGQWLTFDSDTPPTPYKIAKITNDTRLTLATPYTGQSLTGGTCKYRHQKIVKRSIDEILEMPLTDEKEADAFRIELMGLGWGLDRNQAKLDTPVFWSWRVAAYLQKESNQSKEQWPEVLGLWCQTYVELLTANTMLSCMASPGKLEALLAATQESNKTSPLSDGVKALCHEAVLNLGVLVKELPASWEADKEEMRNIVTAVRPVAREHGLYAHLGTWMDGLILYVARGNGQARELAWDYKKNTAWLVSMSVHAPKTQVDSFTPKYELLVVESGAGRVWRHHLDSVRGDLADGTVVIAPRSSRPERFLDVSGFAFHDKTPGVDASTHPRTLAALVVEDSAHARYVNYYTFDKDLKSTRVDTEPYLSDVAEIRSLYLPASTLPDDPHADALTGANRPEANSVLTYGGIRGSNRLHVMEWIDASTVEGPQNWTTYNGVEIDAHYVWLYGRGGIACATHTSMLKARRGKIARPAWIYHDFDKQFTRPEVNSLCPCVDGTLTVAMIGQIYTADYKIDRKTNRIVTSSWVRRGGKATQVVKMPIPCWSVLESLNERLRDE